MLKKIIMRAKALNPLIMGIEEREAQKEKLVADLENLQTALERVEKYADLAFYDQADPMSKVAVAFNAIASELELILGSGDE